MSANVEGRGLIHQGDKTTTGGVVTQGVGNVMFCGSGITQTGMEATCPSCKKGKGNIIPLSKIAVIVDGIQAALHGDVVACGCPYGNNTVIASSGAMSFKVENGLVRGLKPFDSKEGMDAAYQTMADSIGGQYNPNSSSSIVGQQAYEFAEKEWNENLKDDLKNYLELRHTQTCLFTVKDAAKCALNVWAQKKTDGETVGNEILSILDEIHSNIDIGVGFIAASKVSMALGGLGITTKQYIDSKGKERIIISSLWNDKKSFYAVVNGLNVKKNHPYLITNPTVKQLGVLASDTISGFKKGAVLSLIVSVGINTNEIVFNDDYHLVDWFGNVGADLFKAMLVLSVSALFVSVSVMLGISVPMLVGVLFWVGVEFVIGSAFDSFDVDERIIRGLKDATGN